jgi:pimeloyl-ACP methyl ester carboxylesterase
MASSEGKWFKKWLDEVPDYTWVPDKGAFWVSGAAKGDLLKVGKFHHMLSTAAFQIQHQIPDPQKNPAHAEAVTLAGVEGLLRAYESLLPNNPQNRSEKMDEAVALRNKGALAAFVKALNPLPGRPMTSEGPSTQAPQMTPVTLQGTTEAYRTEELSLHVGQFSLVGDLIIPKKGGKHPVLIIVPGDGPFTRASGVRMLKSLGVFDHLLAEGYAVFIDDKPGYGASKGMFSQDNLLHERATLLSRWIEHLKTHPAVDAKCIGFAGQSQAGYVMPLALAETPDIAFMIALSCPAVDSVTQFAYLIEKQLLCDGVPEAVARKVYDAFRQRGKARSYQEYRQAAEFLASIPAAKEWVRGDIQTEQEFKPTDPGSEDFFGSSLNRVGNPRLKSRHSGRRLQAS